MYVQKSSSAVGAPRLNAILSSVSSEATLKRRQYGYGYGYGYGYSGWSGYGRWIVLGVVVGLAVLVWLSVCFCNRRRTRSGMKPVKYTGWATPYQHPQQSGVVSTGQGYGYGGQQQQQPYVAPQQAQYPMQSYQTGGYPQQGAYEGNGTDYTQPPSYPAPVAGREK